MHWNSMTPVVFCRREVCAYLAQGRNQPLPALELSPRYIGSFTIQRQINEVTYQLQPSPRYRIHPTFHVSLLKPFSPCAPGPTELDKPSPPDILNQPSIYQVRNILDSWQQGGWLEYLVAWEIYGPEERSWVAQDGILNPMLLEEFHLAVAAPEPSLEEGVILLYKHTALNPTPPSLLFTSMNCSRLPVHYLPVCTYLRRILRHCTPSFLVTDLQNTCKDTTHQYSAKNS
ncbi:hypothetical protein M9458_035459 [Cirrhinus mrigala]|uniref:Chromo domain-containing protein n=1 Tax=Cirrhinus mrigala TaxID=683832 RepID=A0ABD0P9U7_CIRMR